MTTPCSAGATGHKRQDDSMFPAFPAPRGWQFGGDIWAGPAHQKETIDYLYIPEASPRPHSASIMIRITSAR